MPTQFLKRLKTQGYKNELQQVNDITADHLNDFDLIFLGSACHNSDLADPVRYLLDNISEPTHFKIAGFVTHATKMPDGENKNQVLYERWASACEETFARASQEKGFEFLGYFNCQGAPTPPIEDFIHREILPDEGEWQTYLSNVRNHPDEEDLIQAKTFAREVLFNIP